MGSEEPGQGQSEGAAGLDLSFGAEEANEPAATEGEGADDLSLGLDAEAAPADNAEPSLDLSLGAEAEAAAPNLDVSSEAIDSALDGLGDDLSDLSDGLSDDPLAAAPEEVSEEPVTAEDEETTSSASHDPGNVPLGVQQRDVHGDTQDPVPVMMEVEAGLPSGAIEEVASRAKKRQPFVGPAITVLAMVLLLGMMNWAYFAHKNEQEMSALARRLFSSPTVCQVTGTCPLNWNILGKNAPRPSCSTGRACERTREYENICLLYHYRWEGDRWRS